MKANELMIGNWYYWEAEGKKYPMQVTKDTFRLSDEDISNFQPIPLTPEILEKNGFEHEKQKVIIPSRSQDEVELEYLYCKGLPCSFDIIHGYLMFNSNIDLVSIRMAVNYLHELQHILRLCKISKEIVV